MHSRSLAPLRRPVGRVEAAFGGTPQDIEGVWADGLVTIVQSRPQVI